VSFIVMPLYEDDVREMIDAPGTVGPRRGLAVAPGTSAWTSIYGRALRISQESPVACTSPQNRAAWRLLEASGFARDGNVHDPLDATLWRWIGRP